VVLLSVLAVLLISSLAAGAAVGLAQTVARREREAQWMFVGTQYQNAIAAYCDNQPPGGARALPQRLQDLVQDFRFQPARTHLRQLYPDPLAPEAGWLTVRNEHGIVGVRSRSDARPWRKGLGERYSDWRFTAAHCAFPEQ
jgi:type II secretory pathway pseudopilin PulG